MNKTRIITAVVLALLLLAGCGSRGGSGPEPEETSTPAPTAAPTATPTVTPSATPAVSTTATPVPTLAPTATPTLVPTFTPTAVPTFTPTPVPDPPFVTKHPVSVTVQEGGSCQFEAGYVNAIWAVWHFVSPDGQTDITYEQIGQRFPTMQVANGMYSTMQLSNIPIGANGWKVYCRYTNNGGSSDTRSAVLTVTERAAPADFGLAGEYMDSVGQRASMRISGSATLYSVTIRWGSSYNETTEWTFSGSFDSTGVLRYYDGVKSIITYDAYGNPNSVIQYTGGTGSLIYFPATGTISWEDNRESAGASCRFVRGPAPTAVPTNPPAVNEWVDTTDLNAAIYNCGVDFGPPVALPEGYYPETYSSRPGIIEARYSDSGGSRALVIRKSETVSGDALSGDYNAYSHYWDIVLKGVTVHCKGDGNTANVALIDAGISHYSIVCHPGQEGRGLTPDEINTLVMGHI